MDADTPHETQSGLSCSSFQGRNTHQGSLHLYWELCVTLDDQLSFTHNIAATTCSCIFMLHNIRRTRPFLNQTSTKVSCLEDYRYFPLPACMCHWTSAGWSYLTQVLPHYSTPPHPVPAQAHPTSRTHWLDTDAPHQNCSLSRLQNGGTISQLTSGQKKHAHLL